MKLPIESEMALATLAGVAEAERKMGNSHVSGHIEEASAKLREIIARQIEALEEAHDYFDNLSDADHDGERFIPNAEMSLARAMSNAITPEVF